jgi:hypothetical protein
MNRYQRPYKEVRPEFEPAPYYEPSEFQYTGRGGGRGRGGRFGQRKEYGAGGGGGKDYYEENYPANRYITLQYITVTFLVSFTLPAAYENLDFVMCGSQTLTVSGAVT